MSLKLRMLSCLHCPSMTMLIVAAILLGIMPVTPEPHLIEKVRMLLNGTLVKPVDMFDLFWHGWPLLWIALRLLTPGAGGSCKV
ncbi:MAG: hypothetical protein COW18_05140 [Zetaproteobacteria bacterium CG12_big_fil_rev_8_21_14_0_65_54_13]|nr:MAG: hypothetical protein COX55_05975 [Zetaproteobacteria bacterium CG23_combo_of_CG06-09_8_20_14_all_54_7]PIW49608.1 MAG: hypothetical protein COW18_05140 [Zetaproteobacteria bacterium CG12_big_fil_rev_8_21_14_0_65_54_13]PIX53726.1 MAG: hypothetical protein COZ50_11765 [Zetaproteobacteria bacterium CG_4_10_14_3_um_filter_54_28]PJA31179.1 MAG: hypothetical protein CO188_00170 [Zetaproteobacteria bacterium CG_4_9_14_3_um_filter_54_145]